MSSENQNLEQILQMGIKAAKQGNRQGARVLFSQVLDDDKRNDRAWVWMASVAENKTKQRQYLETALRINPNNPAARKAVQQMRNSRSRSEQRTLMMGIVMILVLLIVAALLCLVAVAA